MDAQKKNVYASLDPVWKAMSSIKRRRYDEAVDICSTILEKNPRDKVRFKNLAGHKTKIQHLEHVNKQAVWFLKCRSLTLKSWVDDTDIVEEDGMGDAALDDNVIAAVPRPGTSLSGSSSVPRRGGKSVRPIDASGRPMSGFIRPNTASKRGDLQSMLNGGNRVGTQSRPVTALGRQVRLGTASLLRSSDSNVFVDVERLDLSRYANRPELGKVLCDYLLFHDQNPKKAAELCSEATRVNEFKDWWWKARLGKAYYRLGLYRLAEKQYKSSIKDRAMVFTTLELGKMYAHKLDEPNTALDLYRNSLSNHFANDLNILINMARLHDVLGTTVDGDEEEIEGKDNPLESVRLYRNILRLDPTSVEAMSCLGTSALEGLEYQRHTLLNTYHSLTSRQNTSHTTQVPTISTRTDLKLRYVSIADLFRWVFRILRFGTT